MTVNGAVAVIDVIQTFINDKDHPLEVSLKFPVKKEYVVGRLTISIGKYTIEGKIYEKKKAYERYYDNITSGHTAAMALEDDDEQEMINLKVGNLLAN